MSNNGQSQGKVSSKTVGVVFIVLGMAIVIIGLYNIISIMIRSSEKEAIIEKNTTVQATVLNTWSERVRKSKSAGGKRYYVTEYHISAAYTYNDIEYRASDLNLGSKKVEINDTVTLYIDPDTPSKAIYNTGTDKTGTLIFRGLISFAGLMLAVIGIFIIKKVPGFEPADIERSLAMQRKDELFMRSHPDPSYKDLQNHFEHYGEFSQSELSQYIDMAHRTNNMNTIYERTPTDEELLRAQQDSYNNKSAERRKRAEMERYQDSRGFGSNYIDNPKAKYEKGSDAWDDDLPPIYDEPPEYQASKFARPSPAAGKYDPNVAYRSPDMDSLDPISPFTSNDSDDDDGWGFLEK